MSEHLTREQLDAAAKVELEKINALPKPLKPKDKTAIPAQPMPQLEPSYRARVMEEVAQGYTEAQAIVEANRCLACKKPFCVESCPVHIDIPAFIAKIAEGDFKAFDQNEEEQACAAMLEWYNKIDESYFGHDYRFTFESSMKRGDDPQTVAVNIKGVEYQEQYMPPAFSLKEWIKEHVLLTVLMILLVLILIVLAIVLSVVGHKKKARKLKDLENKQRIAEAEAQQAIAQANSSLDEYKRQQEKNRVADQERAKQERLATLMKTKNVYPRLVYEIEGLKSTYDMTKPTVTIGRDAGNDIVLNHSSVSRQHAIITYDGYGFYIIDTNSTNHVLVNGMVQAQTLLHSADTIQLGQVKIIFYL